MGVARGQAEEAGENRESLQPASTAGIQIRVDKEEYIGLRGAAAYWKARHGEAVQREADLKRDNEELRARIRELEGRLYSRRSECLVSEGKSPSRRPVSSRPRGQQPGSRGHGRSSLEGLEAREEVAELPQEQQKGPRCGRPLDPFPGTDEAQVVEIETRVWRRVIRRRRYHPSCGCGVLPGIVTAPSPARLIRRGKLGISVWVRVILDKYLYSRPSHRLLQQLASPGVRLSPGTIAGGLRQLLPLLEPVREAIRSRQLSEDRWQADETGWRVFVEVADQPATLAELLSAILRRIGQPGTAAIEEIPALGNGPRPKSGLGSTLWPGGGMKRYCGRRFTGEEIGQLCALIADNPGRTRAQLSRLACRLLQWRKADGGLKEMSCRVAMLRLHREGLLQLPPPRNRKGGSSRIEHTFWSAPQPPLSRPVQELPGVHLEPVLSRPDSALWNEYIDRYHYLGHPPLPGAQLRDFARWEDRILALLGFGAPAWKTAPRDRFIGWRPSERERNLQLIVNNARFLILPWVQSKNLASKLLALASRQLPQDWQDRYAYRPVLLETFVETQRFTGACYKAANWIHVGQTQGRGKLDRDHKADLPTKSIWLYPLSRHFRRSLRST